jgi:heme-degrading monooxygenase HmoA
MFARHVTMRLKANNAPQFNQTFEQDILPLLRKQNGFQDEFVFVSPDGKEAVAISLWDRRESAEAYDRQAYQQVLRGLSNAVEGTPTVKTYDVLSSTPHHISARS